MNKKDGKMKWHKQRHHKMEDYWQTKNVEQTKQARRIARKLHEKCTPVVIIGNGWSRYLAGSVEYQNFCR